MQFLIDESNTTRLHAVYCTESRGPAGSCCSIGGICHVRLHDTPLGASALSTNEHERSGQVCSATHMKRSHLHWACLPGSHKRGQQHSNFGHKALDAAAPAPVRVYSRWDCSDPHAGWLGYSSAHGRPTTPAVRHVRQTSGRLTTTIGATVAGIGGTYSSPSLKGSTPCRLCQLLLVR